MFSLSDGQCKRLDVWQREQDAKVSESQKDKGFSRVPYYGCSGEAYTYSFTPSTLGCDISVRNNLTKEEIDLTETDW